MSASRQENFSDRSCDGESIPSAKPTAPRLLGHGEDERDRPSEKGEDRVSRRDE